MTDEEFNAIDWANISTEEFNKKVLLCTFPQRRTANGLRPRGPGITINKPVIDLSLPISGEDKFLFSQNIFDMIGFKYEEYDPVYFFKYFYQEADASAKWDEIALAYRMLFDKKASTRPDWKFSIEVKPALRYARSSSSGSGDTFLFPATSGADTWREALIKLMALGFIGTKNQSGDELHASLNTAMLEANFVEDASASGPEGQTGVKIFWRCDSRDRYDYIDRNLAICAVDSDDSARKYHLKERWHPLSDEKVNRHMWLRKSNKDNDYYTIVSVGLDFKTCVAFPLLDEPKAYSFPKVDSTIKPLNQWSDSELRANEKYISQVKLFAGGQVRDKFRLVTKTYGYMIAINRGFVINTQEWGGLGGAAKFPERGIRGMPRDAVVAYIPVLRVHLGGEKDAGFTAYLDPGDPPRLLLSDKEIENRFGQAGERVKAEYDSVVTKLRNGLRSAWAAGGSGEPKVKDVVNSITRRVVLASDIEKNKDYLT